MAVSRIFEHRLHRKHSTLFATSLLVTSLVLLSGCTQAQEAKPTTQVDDVEIKGIGPTSEVRKLQDGFQFTEGPTVDGDGNVYFTDIPNDRIHRLSSDGKLEVFLEPAGHANGLMIVGNNRLLACQMDGQLVSINVKDKSIEVLADKYNDTRFNAPNDLVIDKQGGIYFTDPHYRAPEPWPQETRAVYYRSADGQITRVAKDIDAPNGITLSPDEKKLYVVPSENKEMLVYEVTAPGKLGEAKVLCSLQQGDGSGIAGGDGMTIDTQGNLYITSAIGIQVISPDGNILGVIKLPEEPANVTFGGPNRQTLIATARSSVYAIDVLTTGHIFTGPVSK